MVFVSAAEKRYKKYFRIIYALWSNIYSKTRQISRHKTIKYYIIWSMGFHPTLEFCRVKVGVNWTGSIWYEKRGSYGKFYFTRKYFLWILNTMKFLRKTLKLYEKIHGMENSVWAKSLLNSAKLKGNDRLDGKSDVNRRVSNRGNPYMSKHEIFAFM